MQAQTDDMKKAIELKKQLEKVVGHPIDISADQIIKLWFPVGTNSSADGNATWRSILFPGKNCPAANLFDASGTTWTDTTGQRTFLLSDFICWTQFIFAEPVNIVATPRGAAPSYLSVTHQMVNGPAGTGNVDLQVTVYSWQPGGASAANVSFDWRCRLVSIPIIF